MRTPVPTQSKLARSNFGPSVVDGQFCAEQVGSTIVEGVNHWSQPFDGQTGEPKVSVLRNGIIAKGGKEFHSVRRQS